MANSPMMAACEISMQSLLLGCLTFQIREDDFSVISKLYELAGIDNNKLISKAHTLRPVVDSPDKMIYYDMVYCIVDESLKNPIIFQSFNEILKNKYPTKFAQFEKLQDLWKNGENWERYMSNTYDVKSLKDIAYRTAVLFFPLYYQNEDFLNYFTEYYMKSVEIAKAIMDNSDYDKLDVAFTFNTGEEIFESIQFDKYVNNRKVELAAYIAEQFNSDVDENNVADVIGDLLRAKANAKTTTFSANIDYIPTGVARRTIIDQYGGATWYTEVTADLKGGYENARGYKPDVENIIRSYYREYIKREWVISEEQIKNNFTKGYMLRGCVPANVSEAFNAIMYMYNLDIVCWMFNRVKDKYYENFSWEKVTCQDLSFRYNQIVAELQDNINSLENKLSLSFKEQQRLRENFRQEKSAGNKEDSTAIISLEQEINKLNRKIDDKEDEIVALRRQLESKDEYIKLLMCQEEVDIDSEIDITALQQKKYLFVGHIKEAIPELRRKFPNSIFMEEETTSINNIQVDGIVMLIKYMSHAMFYKVNSFGILRDVPVVRCNTKNINNIYKKMTELELQ